jgi:hypothetical protein
MLNEISFQFATFLFVSCLSDYALRPRVERSARPKRTRGRGRPPKRVRLRGWRCPNSSSSSAHCTYWPTRKDWSSQEKGSGMVVWSLVQAGQASPDPPRAHQQCHVSVQASMSEMI